MWTEEAHAGPQTHYKIPVQPNHRDKRQHLTLLKITDMLTSSVSLHFSFQLYFLW